MRIGVDYLESHEMKRLIQGGVLLLAMVANSGASEPLGRLFFTPERRQMLERGRGSPNTAVPASETGASLSLDGIVRRSHGPATVWINGRPHPAGPDSIPGAQIRLQKAGPGAEITESEEQATVQLTVGEWVNRGSHEKSGLLPPGAISHRTVAVPVSSK